MPLIQWSNQLSVGIASIDEQHKKLVNMINVLNDALEEGQTNEVLGKIFDSLAVYTVKHFGYEEELFAQHGYGASSEHKLEHEALLKQVGDLQQKMQDGYFIVSVVLLV